MLSAPLPNTDAGVVANVVSLRPARQAAVLMLVEGLLLGLAAAYAGRQIDWTGEVFGAGISGTAADTATSASFFTVLAGAAAVAAIGMFFARHFAWVLAMIVQSLTLLASLIIYFVDEPFYGYVLMAFAIATVFYLNSTYVREAFRDTVRPQRKA